jgi:hypothetical protein
MAPIFPGRLFFDAFVVILVVVLEGEDTISAIGGGNLPTARGVGLVCIIVG